MGLPRQSRTRTRALCLSALALTVLALAPSASSAAPIGGRLDQPGYTVIAMTANGQAAATVARDGSFAVEPPRGETVTLHLRSPSGTYAGPLVVEETGAALRRAKAQVRKAKRKVRKAKRKVRRARRQAKAAHAESPRRPSG